MHDSPSAFGTSAALSGAVVSGLVVLLMGLAFGASGDSLLPASGAPGSAPGSTYVPDLACAGCHAAQYEAWRTSHHFHAMGVPDEASVRGNFQEAVTNDGHSRYRFLRRDGRYLVEVADGEGRLEHEVRFTFGWEPLQQYLLDGERGRLQALTIAWDAGRGRWFDLAEGDPAAPGDPLHWSGRDYTWNFQCADCHSTGLRRNYSLEADRYQTTFAAVNVGCQACHGPGGAHITWAEDYRRRDGTGRAETEIADKKLAISFSDSGFSQVEVCAQCHSRRRPIRDHPVAGEPFLDHFLPELLSEGLYFADGQIQDEVFELGSFLQSRMHRAGVVCSNCHDPHSGALPSDGNAVCTACHSESPPERFATIPPLAYDSPAHHFHTEGEPGSFCVDCHMPARTYMKIDLRRDHSFRIPRPDLAAATGAPDACTGCHSDRDARWAAAQIAEWYGQERRQEAHFGAALAAGRSGAPGAGAALAALAADKRQAGIARATALEMLQYYLDEETLPAVAAALADPEPLVRIGALRALEAMEVGARVELAAPLLDDPLRAVRITAAQVLAPLPDIAFAGGSRPAFVQATGEYLASELAAAERPESHFNLGLYWAEQGDMKKSEAAFRTALRLAPDFVPAIIHLAELKRALGDSEEEQLLERAREIAPRDATVLHALGLLRIRQGLPAEALRFLAEAAAAAPETGHYAYVHAVALNSLGRAGEAYAVVAAALERHPYSIELLTGLLQLQLRADDRGAARSTLERLIALQPEDAHLVRLRRQLGQP